MSMDHKNQRSNKRVVKPVHKQKICLSLRREKKRDGARESQHGRSRGTPRRPELVVLKRGRLRARLPAFIEPLVSLRAAGRGLALSAAAARAGGGGAWAAAAAGPHGANPTKSSVLWRACCLCLCCYSLSVQHASMEPRREKHQCRSCPRRAGADSQFISAVCAQASRKCSSSSSFTEHLLKACTANVISPFLAVMLLNIWSSSFKSRLF